MPLYEYFCPHCKLTFEALRPISDSDKKITCKICARNDSKRQVSLFYAQSNGKSITKQPSGCHNCSGGSCDSCGR